LQRIGLNSYGEAVTGIKVEWQMDEDVALSDVLTAAITDTTTTTLTVTYGEIFNLKRSYPDRL